ncbi:MAG: hypothetical protein K2L55_01590 [Muribaculaceae bacterium]|nr:hypothetical protein [Muribaculaceae bacterium]
MYKSYISNDTLLFPPNLGDFIPQDAPSWLISDIVDLLDLKEIHDSYSKASDGQPPYHPSMLLKVVLQCREVRSIGRGRHTGGSESPA